MTTIKILGVKVNNITEKEALEFIIKGLEQKGRIIKIFTPNPEIIMAALKDEGFKRVLNTADVALADGVGLLWAAKMLGKQLQKRIAGVDFMEMLCKEASKRGLTVGFLGGRPKIAERTAECLLRRYPSLKVVFAGEEWLGAEAGNALRSVRNFSRQQLQSPPVDKHSLLSKNADIEKFVPPRATGSPRLNESIDILFVAFGFPKQEQWIYENLPKIPVGVAMAVGGSFDYMSGAVPRAPLLVRKLGFEWLFRLIREPWRIHRQLALIAFVLLVLKEKFSRGGLRT